MDTAIVKDMGKLAELAYGSWNIGQVLPNTSYTVLETQDTILDPLFEFPNLVGFQAQLVFKEGEPPVIAFRGTETASHY